MHRLGQKALHIGPSRALRQTAALVQNFSSSDLPTHDVHSLSAASCGVVYARVVQTTTITSLDRAIPGGVTNEVTLVPRQCPNWTVLTVQSSVWLLHPSLLGLKTCPSCFPVLQFSQASSLGGMCRGCKICTACLIEPRDSTAICRRGTFPGWYTIWTSRLPIYD
jgi:hypothetical protein